MSAKILLVDDHRTTVASHLNLLRRRLDAEFKAAYDGGEAIELARTFRPDLIVLDLNLPVLTGFQVLEQLQRFEIETRVIILSGYDDIPTVVRCIRAGACDYLKKPVDTDALTDHIKRSLLLESAYNLQITKAPIIIQQLLDRAENMEQEVRDGEAARRKRALEDERERRAHARWDRILSAAISLLYVAVALAAVTIIHARGLITSANAVLAFFLGLVFLLLLPTERIRDAVISAYGARASLKMDSAEDKHRPD